MAKLFTTNKLILGVSFLITILIIVVTIIYLPKTIKPSNKPAGTGVVSPTTPSYRFPQALQELIDQSVAKSPKARFVFILESNELSITYTPETKAFVVVAHKEQDKNAIYEGADKWFNNLGVNDISKLTLFRRIDPS